MKTSMIDSGDTEQNQRKEMIFKWSKYLSTILFSGPDSIVSCLSPRARRLQESVKGETAILLEPPQVLTASVIIRCVIATALGIKV